MKRAKDLEKDRMIGSIGFFWGANETWLVLGIGLLLVAFPKAHGITLSDLYLPVAIMLMGLTLRGVAFDFRAKAKVAYKNAWNNAFFIGYLITVVAQGYMLGSFCYNDLDFCIVFSWAGLQLLPLYCAGSTENC